MVVGLRLPSLLVSVAVPLKSQTLPYWSRASTVTPRVSSALVALVAGLTVSVQDWAPVAVGLVVSVAWTAKVKAPAAVGVPPSTPAALNDRPAGSEPEASVKL